MKRGVSAKTTASAKTEKAAATVGTSTVKERDNNQTDADVIHIAKEEIATMPVDTFDGRIIVAQTEEEARKGIAYLSKFNIVGIDTESKPAFKKGEKNKVSLLQISTIDCCILFRLNMIGLIPEIKEFFENESILKAGVSLKDDFLMLRSLVNFEPHGFVEIQDMVDKLSIGEKSLQKIYAILFGKRISKTQRLSNWNADILSDPQKRYAATDAWASLKIYSAFVDKGVTPLYRERLKMM